MPEQNDKTSSYRSIFKATSLFGGIQIYQIIIGVIRSKFVAVLLGPAGIGIQGLYLSAIQLIQEFSSFGLSRSSVRNVSEANGTGDIKHISRTIAVVKRLVWITGLLGLTVTVILSPILSKTTFGNYDYTIPFIFLSITLLLDQLSTGQKVVLQGMRRLKYLAKSTAIGSTVGLIVSIPLYYLLGVKGIVPTLILNSVTTLCLTWYFSKKVKIEKNIVTNKQTLQEGKSMLKMGLAMSISSILSLAFAYILRGFIRHEGGVEQVGLFTAGFAILNTSVGMIFNAMITDYYPRLAAINKDNYQCKELINQQCEVGTLIMTPMLLFCLIFMPIIISLLYSKKFLEVNNYIMWAIPGMLFKLSSWAIAILFVAKGTAKLYVGNELTGSIMNFVCNMIGYYFWGLTGLGISFSVGYFIYFVKLYLTAKINYKFAFTVTYRNMYLLSFFLTVVCLFNMLFLQSSLKYITSIILLSISFILSIKGLNKRMNILQFLNNHEK
ncbi:MAG: O-antigen translocase [Clostridia bacterium]|nr:O-antigen translocase [Clostridia bacterium]